MFSCRRLDSYPMTAMTVEDMHRAWAQATAIFEGLLQCKSVLQCKSMTVAHLEEIHCSVKICDFIAAAQNENGN